MGNVNNLVLLFGGLNDDWGEWESEGVSGVSHWDWEELLGVGVAVHVGIDAVVLEVLGQLSWGIGGQFNWGGSDGYWVAVSEGVSEWVGIWLDVGHFVGLSIHVGVDALVGKILCELSCWGCDVEPLACGEAEAEDGELDGLQVRKKKISFTVIPRRDPE